MTPNPPNHDQTSAKRRLCVVTPYLPTLSETFIKAHIERLPAQVTLVHSWPPQIDSTSVLSPAARLSNKVRGFLGQNRKNQIASAYKLALRRCSAEAVLAEYGPSGVMVMDACRELDIPLIVHFHGYDASVHEVIKQNAESYKVMFSVAHAVIAVSRAMERKLISLGSPEEKVFYNPYGIDCERFGGANPREADPVMVAVGRFVEKKAPHLTLQAFAKVQRKVPEARLRMIGNGPLLEDARALAVQLGIGESVVFLGPQPPDVVQSELRAARCFVQHSVEATNGDCEGTPLGILEAGASGLPVVSTRHAGIPDVVVEGVTGFLVDEGDFESMATHMKTLMDDPELAGRMGASARAHIKTNLSEHQSLSRLWKVIESTISRPKPLK